MESEYGKKLLNEIEERNLDAADANLVRSYGVKLSLDGDHWFCLLGENIQKGHATFGKTPHSAVTQMRAYIYSGGTITLNSKRGE